MMSQPKSRLIFPVVIAAFLLLACGLIVIMQSKIPALTKEDVGFFGQCLLGIYIGGSLIVFFAEFGKRLISRGLFFYYLLVFSFVLLLASLVFMPEYGSFFTGVFVAASLVYWISEKGRIYALNKVYIVVFLYALLRFIGTIGTERGFHFPDKTYSFYILPVIFSFFRFDKSTLFKILRVFSRTVMIYLSLSVIYWWFHTFLFDVPASHWLTHKDFYGGGYASYCFVGGWTGYVHPSFISLMVVLALITYLYLFYKKNSDALISKTELLLFIVLCFLTDLALGSRIGVIMAITVLLISVLYFLRLRRLKYAIVFLGIGVAITTGMLINNGFLSKIMQDKDRATINILSANYIKNHLLWGCGYNQEAAAFEYQESIMSPGDLPIPGRQKTHAHNQLIGDTMQFGLTGALVFLVMFSVLAYYSVKNRNYLLQMFLVVFFLFMLIEEPLYIQDGITRFMVFLAFFIHFGESDVEVKSYELRNWFAKRNPA